MFYSTHCLAFVGFFSLYFPVLLSNVHSTTDMPWGWVFCRCGLSTRSCWNHLAFVGKDVLVQEEGGAPSDREPHG